MKRMSTGGFWRVGKWLRDHWFSMSLVAVAIVASAAFVGYSFYTVEAQIAATEKQRAADTKKYDALIAKLTAERKAKELAAKKAAEEKARQDAAAKAAATTSDQAASASSASCNTSTSHNDPTKFDVIVNKRNCLVPLSYAPADLTTSYGATLRSEAAAQFGALVQAAASQGITIGATSSYRSYAAQVSTYQHWVAVNGGIAAADQVSARAGYSEHQTGLAVDVSTGGCALDCFAGTSAYAWMKNNSYKYGFVERYPPGQTSITGYSPEAWHYRYVGVGTATAMVNSGTATLEQYFGFPAAPTY